MTSDKKLGIWMDHSNAHIMEFHMDSIETSSVTSKSSYVENEPGLGKYEYSMQTKEQNIQFAYYKKLGEIILNYRQVILFGPTDAKLELLNILKTDHRVEKIKIEIKQTDKMTENQQHSFVREYFNRN